MTELETNEAVATEPVATETVQKGKYVTGVGRRKEAVALVRLRPGKGHYVVNGKPFPEYFTREAWRAKATNPLKQIGQAGKFDISVQARGGGLSAQADAVSLGVARALLHDNPDAKGTLKKAGLLTRDQRIKERRKYGLKKARKAPQFSKR